MVKFVVKEREENEACFVIDEDEGLIFELTSGRLGGCKGIRRRPPFDPLHCFGQAAPYRS